MTELPVLGCNRCGDCCRVIALPFTKADMRSQQNVYPDGVQIYRMLQRISKQWVREREPNFNLDTIHHGWFLYRCLNLDPATNRCRIYDQRPAMCRDYPYYGGNIHTGLSSGRRRQCGYPLYRHKP